MKEEWRHRPYYLADSRSYAAFFGHVDGDDNEICKRETGNNIEVRIDKRIVCSRIFLANGEMQEFGETFQYLLLDPYLFLP